jgi:hypothetical protein
MAFGLASLKAYGLECTQPLTKKFTQIVEFNITATAAEVAYDLGAVGGTFWTAVGGANADALAAWKSILGKIDKTINVNCSEIFDPKVRVGSGTALGAGQYKMVSTPDTSLAITIQAGEGVTAATVICHFTLKAGQFPVQFNVV